ncbi:hypothetical protein [Pseudarthrobacter sp. DSP2-3-2b1]|uniref:hypothetical protein n=1 Tax=Pseudarthrobacter sp. DSP2-3-2b1 TaxID=2804661 RepID=UPI003CF04282
MTVVGLNRRRSLARGLMQAAAAVVLAASLASCAPAETGLQRDAARQLQERVLGVSQAAAANDHAAALTALDSLETELSAAADNGQVSEERRRTVMTVITAVRADLNAAIDAAAKAAAEAKAAEEKTKADADAAAKAAQQSAAPVVPAPAPAPAPADNGNEGKGNEGKGKDKDD